MENIYSWKIVHDGVRPFVCPICNKTYQYKSDVKRHVQLTHEGKKPWVCSLCNSRYTRKMSLQYHVKSVHKLSAEPQEEASITENTENPEIKKEALELS